MKERRKLNVMDFILDPGKRSAGCRDGESDRKTHSMLLFYELKIRVVVSLVVSLSFSGVFTQAAEPETLQSMHRWIFSTSCVSLLLEIRHLSNWLTHNGQGSGFFTQKVGETRAEPVSASIVQLSDVGKS